MFVGHYAASLAARALVPRAPLPLLLLSSQLVDVGWGVLVSTGIERVRIDPSIGGANPLVLEHMPYTHSLVASLVWATVAAAAAGARWGRGVAVAVGVVVASHWWLDLVMHRPDLAVVPGGEKYGLGLWEAVLPSHALELALVWATAAFAVRRGALSPRGAYGMAAFLMALQASNALVTPPGTVALAVSAVGSYVLVAGLGAWAERARNSG